MTRRTSIAKLLHKLACTIEGVDEKWSDLTVDQRREYVHTATVLSALWDALNSKEDG